MSTMTMSVIQPSLTRARPLVIELSQTIVVNGPTSHDRRHGSSANR